MKLPTLLSIIGGLILAAIAAYEVITHQSNSPCTSICHRYIHTVTVKTNNSINSITTYKYENGTSGRVIEIDMLVNNQTSKTFYTYDDNARTITATYPSGNHITWTLYPANDPNGHAGLIHTDDQEDISTYYPGDKRGWIQSHASNDPDQSKYYQTLTRWDNQGRIIQQTRIYNDPQRNVKFVFDYNTNQTNCIDMYGMAYNGQPTASLPDVQHEFDGPDATAIEQPQINNYFTEDDCHNSFVVSSLPNGAAIGTGTFYAFY